MTRLYTATTNHEISVEWDFDMTRGYPTTWLEPGEDMAIENFSAAVIGPNGQRITTFDELVELLFDHELLAECAEEQAQSRAEDAADARREGRAA
jgi:hypothetical protein